MLDRWVTISENSFVRTNHVSLYSAGEKERFVPVAYPKDASGAARSLLHGSYTRSLTSLTLKLKPKILLLRN